MLKRFLLTSALLFACSVSALAQTTTAKSKVAPADEYFGRLKMSILGIGNTIKDMRLRVEADAEKSGSIFGSLANCEDAIRDWEHKYPKDSWIPRSLYNLEVAYLHAQGDRARELAIHAEAWLRHDYPKSTYTAQAHDELSKAIAAASAPVVQPAVAGALAAPPNAPAPDTAPAPAAPANKQ